MDQGVSRRDLLAASLISFNAFTWAYLTAGLLKKALEFYLIQPSEQLLYLALYYFALGAFNIVGQIVPKIVRRINFLHAWTVYGGLITFSPALFPNFLLNHLASFAFILGASVGIGIPSTLAYLSDMTAIQERGTVSGITLFVSYVSLVILGLTVQSLDLIKSSLVYALWRFWALATVLLRPREPEIDEREKPYPVSRAQRISSFVLYLIPWTMFSLVDQSTKPVVKFKTELVFPEKEFLGFLNVTGVIVGGLSSLIGGVQSDRLGRKRTIILALVFLGLGYAILGLTPYESVSQFYFAVVNGIAWGVLTSTFVFTIWGDLAPKGSREKYYSIGVSPLFLAGVVSITLTDVLAQIGAERVFYLACLMLFLSIIPLLAAPETLPHDVVERRRFKKYMKEAKRLREGVKSL